MATDHFLNISNKVIKHVNDITRRRDEKYDGKILMLWDNFSRAEKKTLLETHDAYAYVNYYLMVKHGHFVDGVRLHAHGLEVYFDC